MEERGRFELHTPRGADGVATRGRSRPTSLSMLPVFPGCLWRTKRDSNPQHPHQVTPVFKAGAIAVLPLVLSRFLFVVRSTFLRLRLLWESVTSSCQTYGGARCIRNTVPEGTHPVSSGGQQTCPVHAPCVPNLGNSRPKLGIGGRPSTRSPDPYGSLSFSKRSRHACPVDLPYQNLLNQRARAELGYAFRLCCVCHSTTRSSMERPGLEPRKPFGGSFTDNQISSARRFKKVTEEQDADVWGSAACSAPDRSPVQDSNLPNL
jgi:hypothetical protein